MPKWFILVVVAFLTAALLTEVADQRPFEEILERANIVDRANAPGSKCPLSQETIEWAEVGLLSICLAHGLSAYEAARRYPESATKVYAVYGQEEIFWTVLDQYGHDAVPVVAYYVENGSRELQVRQTLGEVWQQLWAGQTPKWELANLTREQIGLIAIHRLAARGYEMLAEFEIVDGAAKRKPMTSIILAAKDFLLGNLSNVETILVRGERLPTWRETGLAALDVTVVGTAGRSLTRMAGAGSGLVVEKSTGRVIAESAFQTVTSLGTITWDVAPLAFVYFAIERPALLGSLGGWIAEQLGVNRFVGIFAVYFCGSILVLWFLFPLIWFGRLLCRLYRLLAHLARLHWTDQAAFSAA
jgi:hypothetical protein